MDKITRQDPTVEVDTLNGVAFFPGETIRLQWPDGSVTTEVIGVDQHPEGDRSACTRSRQEAYRAFVEARVRGALSRVYILGLYAERETPPKFRAHETVHLPSSHAKAGKTYRVLYEEWDYGWQYALVSPERQGDLAEVIVEESVLLDGADPSDTRVLALLVTTEGPRDVPL